MPIRLPAVFTDSLVLQRQKPIPIWGWAEPGEAVTATVGGRSARAVAAADGRWQATLSPLPAGGPHELVVRGERSGEAVVRDVLVGEVWLCSGQSNMQWSADISGYPADELAGADHPDLRLLLVPVVGTERPLADVQARWRRCSGEALRPFSGVAYAFGRQLQRALGVPVGLIQSALGGTAAEWWTRIEVLRADPDLAPIVSRYEAGKPYHPADSAEFKRLHRAWQLACRHEDPGNAGEPKGWAALDCDEREWETMRLPQLMDHAGLDIDGAVWFRRAFEAPASWKGRQLTLRLGGISDYDTSYVNGQRIGGIGAETRQSHLVPRVYRVDGESVRAGRNLVAVRVFNIAGDGGFRGPAEEMRIHPSDAPDEVVPLTGDWRYRVELGLPSIHSEPPEPRSAEAPGLPERLYNGMIAPIAGFALRGAIWYQGESNADRAEQYVRLLSAMIADWRRAWSDAFPFLQVQLAPFMDRHRDGRASAWAELRAAQQAIADTVPGVGMASLIDSGAGDDIHPRNKALVGWRLALVAQREVYGQDVVASGPRFREAVREGAALRVRFRGAAGGLMAHGCEPVRGFVLAGANRTFHQAVGKIDGGDSVIVRSDAVAEPTAVRYCWADNPDGNLIGYTGLPVPPFRSDEWPGVTTGKR